MNRWCRPRSPPPPTPPRRLTRPGPGAAGDDDGRTVSNSFGDLDANLDKVLDVETVRPLVAALPERQRTVLLLRFFENMTQTQIAERLGISQMQRLAPPGSISRRIAGTSSDTNTGMSRLV
jgi:DNA-directed RNA polymerase specialized sigma24 family protein